MCIYMYKFILVGIVIFFNMKKFQRGIIIIDSLHVGPILVPSLFSLPRLTFSFCTSSSTFPFPFSHSLFHLKIVVYLVTQDLSLQVFPLLSFLTIIIMKRKILAKPTLAVSIVIFRYFWLLGYRAS